MKALLTLLAFVFILFHFAQVFAQTAPSVVELKLLGEQGILLDKGWKFHAGDNPEWAKPAFDDSGWQVIDPTKDIHNLPQLWQTNIGWFRLQFSVDSSLLNNYLALIMQQSGASELFLNGKVIKAFGEINSNATKTKAYDPLWNPFLFPVKSGSTQVLAIRYALQPNIYYTTIFETINPALWMKLVPLEKGINFYQNRVSNHKTYIFFLMGAFIILGTVHLAFYKFYRAQKSNLYFGVFALLHALVTILHYVFYLFNNEVERKFYSGNLAMSFIIIGHLFLLTAIYSLLNRKKDYIFWFLTVYVFISIGLNILIYDIGWRIGGAMTTLLIALNTARIAYQHLKTNKRGAWIIFAGTVIFFSSFFVFFSQSIIYGDFGANLNSQRIVTYIFYNLSIPVATSIYLGLEFAFTSRALAQKLTEVEKLSKQAINQEQEKQQILAAQNETLEKQVEQRTAELTQQKEELQNTLEHLKATQAQLIQKEKMASLGELTAGIAHEIQNPLNFMNNFSEVSVELMDEMEKELAAGDKEEALGIAADVKANLHKIHQHGQRADTIVKGMLQHSRVSTGQKEPTDINALTEEYLRLSYHGLRAKDKELNVKLITNFDTSLVKVALVPQDIGRVLLNLFNNAFYATQQKKNQLNGQYQPEVRVSTCQHDGRVEIKVRDNGTGMPEQVKSKIFQPFFTTKPTGQGTGLGLSLSYDIITKGHGGELTVITHNGDFSEFIIKLPR